MKNIKSMFRAKTQTALKGLMVVVAAGALFATSAPAVSAAPNCQNPYTLNPDTGKCELQSTSGGTGSTGTDGGAGSSSTSTSGTPKVTPYAPSCAEQDPAIKSPGCAGSGGKCATVDSSNCDLVANYIDPAIGFLTALIGVAVAAAVIYGGIEIGSSAGDPSRAASGKKHIRNALFTLVVYFFLYSLLNFLIPGGINQ